MKKSTTLAFVFMSILYLALPFTSAHVVGETDVFVRVVSANPATKTYTFSCTMDPDNNLLRDWFIRPDTGTTEGAPEEATFLDEPSGQHLTYSFKENKLYHIGCLIVDTSTNPVTVYRGDLHIDLRTSGWDPEIVPVSVNGLTSTLACEHSGSGTPTWEALNAATGESFNIGSGNQITHTVPGHGLWDYICSVDGKSTGLPVEYFDQGDPYFPDAQGVPHGIKTTRDGSGGDGTGEDDAEGDGSDDQNDGSGNNGGDGDSTQNGLVRTDTDGGLTASFSCKPEGSSSDLVVDWNFGDGQVIFDTDHAVSHTYASAGNRFVQCDVWDNVNAEFTSLQKFFDVSAEGNSGEDNTGGGDGGDGSDGGTGGACYSSLEDMPATCGGGTITQDTFNGCRTLVCSSSGSSIQVLACEKPNNHNPQYFEMYKQSQSGTGLEVCLADTCIQNEGYKKSGNYPVCTDGSSDGSDGGDGEPTGDDGGDSGNSGGNTGVTCTDHTSGQSCPQLSDVTSGVCRVVEYAEPGQTSIAIRAQGCLKDGTMEVSRQMYDSQHNLEVCFGSVCVDKNWGFRTGPASSGSGGSEGTGGGTSTLLGTPNNWIAPTNGLTNVAPNYFHLELNQLSNSNQHSSSDFEVWNNAETQRVWSAYDMGGLFKYHTHTPDGQFENSFAGQTQLNSGTTYKTRVRFKDTNGEYTDWSAFRSFTTLTSGGSNGGGGTDGTDAWMAAPGFKVEKFSTGFDLPVHVAAAPNIYTGLPENQRPFLYVTELYGDIKVVYKDGSQSTYASNLLNFDPFGSITGGGQMGLIGLYVEPGTGDLYVGMTYVENNEVKNKLVKFVSSSDGKTFTSSQTLIDNLPSGPSHQIQQITKGPDGKIYVGLGDALQTSLPQDDSQLAGKIIRMNTDGSSVETYAKGFRNPFGADWRPGTNQLFVTDNAPDFDDRLIKVNQGENYGWCCDISKRIATLGVSPVDVEFNPGGSGFPADLNGKLYVGVAGPIYQQGQVSNGKHILEFTLDGNGNVASNREFVNYVGSGYGTPIGMDFASDGLYFTDIYGEPGFVGLGETEGNVYRVSPGTQTGGTGEGSFRAGISIIPWYPKDLGGQIEYIFECQGIDGSGNYKYDWNLGNGDQLFNQDNNRKDARYPDSNQDYTVSCTVHDQNNGQSASASMVINPSDFIPDFP